VLREAIATLPHLPPDARPEWRALRDLLAPHLGTVVRVLERTASLAATLRRRQPAVVVCHTDAHGGNVMRDAAGGLWLIDWETARLAPPEHDLWMFGARVPELLPAYERGLGRPFTPDADRLRYYVLRRPLEDLAEDVRWLLHDSPAPQVAAHSLEIIARYVLPALLGAEADAEATASRGHQSY
jgi:spectinomycin phosphotransferase